MRGRYPLGIEPLFYGDYWVLLIILVLTPSKYLGILELSYNAQMVDQMFRCHHCCSGVQEPELLLIIFLLSLLCTYTENEIWWQMSSLKKGLGLSAGSLIYEEYLDNTIQSQGRMDMFWDLLYCSWWKCVFSFQFGNVKTVLLKQRQFLKLC